jgi:uncharacterized protein YhjY with autotransporter beta-barrel domain
MGEWDSTILSPFPTIEGQETVDDGALTGKVDADGYSVAANATPEQLATATQSQTMCPQLEALDQQGALDDDQQDLLSQCKGLEDDGTSARQTVTALEAITPEEVTAQTTIIRIVSQTQTQTQTQSRNIGGRIAGLRAGKKSISVAGLNLNQGEYSVSGSIGNSKVDFDNNGGDTEADNYAFALYGSFYTEDAAYVDGIVSYGWSDIDSKRNIVYDDVNGGVNRRAKGNTDGDQYYVSMNAGYIFNTGGWTLDPAARFFYMDGQIDGYQEQGAGGLDLAYGKQDFKSTSLSFSGQVAYAFTPDWGVLVPFARVEYTREFEDNAQGLLYNFVSDPILNDSSYLQIKGDDPDSNFMLYTAGMSAQFKYGLSAYASYSLLGSYDYLDNSTVSCGLRWETTF